MERHRRARRFRLVSLAVFASCAAIWLALVGDAQIESDRAWSPILVLNVVEESTGEWSAARFSISVDGKPHEPRWIGPHGLRFVSVHVSKRQTKVVTYARGTGPVWVPLAPGAKRVKVDVVKGLDYLTVSLDADGSEDPVEVSARLRRWNRLREEGWRAADAHLHYDRIGPDGDRDWFAMMAGDDIAHSQFMTLRGGMVPGTWARQFAFGEEGEAADGTRTIVAGEEYRDRMQGHILLFGLGDLIAPIMAGVPEAPYNFPTLANVMRRARATGALAGIAHGGTFGTSSTALADTVGGAADFLEIANWSWELWPLDNWYRLLNCGYPLPATAGTDLPNNPRREPWQPFLGGMRMYAKTGDSTGSPAWNEAVRRGETFVSSGPVLEFDANGVGPGGTLCLPAEGGSVRVSAVLRSPRDLQRLELVRNGTVVATASDQAREGEVRSLRLETEAQFDRSGWIAVRGEGAPSLLPGGNEVAHTSAVRVLVDGEPIWSAEDGEALVSTLQQQRNHYERSGRYATARDRGEALAVFDQALDGLRANADGTAQRELRPCPGS
ncbi:MAG: hypothetical protein F4173_16325 [Acidobacteriia bacterium]|nr:hypothetical protein [Terriglobia bacterium]